MKFISISLSHIYIYNKMAGRPPLYDRRYTVCVSVQGIFYNLAKEKHLSWKDCLEAGIKLLGQGGDSPKLQQDIIEKHIKIEEQLTKSVDDGLNTIESQENIIAKLKNVREEKKRDRKKQIYY